MAALSGRDAPGALARSRKRAAHVGEVVHGLAVLKHPRAVPIAIAASVFFNGVALLLWIWLAIAWTRTHATQRADLQAWALRLGSPLVTLTAWLPGTVVVAVAASESLPLGVVLGLVVAAVQAATALYMTALRWRVEALLPGHVAARRMRRAERWHAARLALTLGGGSLVLAAAAGALGAPAARLVGTAEPFVALLIVAEVLLSLAAWFSMIRASAAAARAEVLRPGAVWTERTKAWAVALRAGWGLELREASGGLVARGYNEGRRVEVEVDLSVHPAPVHVWVALNHGDRHPQLRVCARGADAAGAPLSDPILSRLVRLTGAPQGAGDALLADLHEPLLGVLQAWPESAVVGGRVRLRAEVTPAADGGAELPDLVDAAIVLAEALDARLCGSG